MHWIDRDIVSTTLLYMHSSSSVVYVTKTHILPFIHITTNKDIIIRKKKI